MYDPGRQSSGGNKMHPGAQLSRRERAAMERMLALEHGGAPPIAMPPPELLPRRPPSFVDPTPREPPAVVPTVLTQLEALHKLMPRLANLPYVSSANVNKSVVPVIALTAEVASGSSAGVARSFGPWRSERALSFSCPFDTTADTSSENTFSAAAKPAGAKLGAALKKGGLVSKLSFPMKKKK